MFIPLPIAPHMPIGLVAPGDRAVWGAPAQGRIAPPINNQVDPYNIHYEYGALTYIGQPDDNDPTGATVLKRVQVGRNAINKIHALTNIGKARFDTRIVRNLIFVTNIQRIMRLKLNQELTQYRNVLISNHSVINPGVTEYGYLPPSSLGDSRLRQYGPANETMRDRRYDNETRLVE